MVRKCITELTQDNIIIEHWGLSFKEVQGLISVTSKLFISLYELGTVGTIFIDEQEIIDFDYWGAYDRLIGRN